MLPIETLKNTILRIETLEIYRKRIKDALETGLVKDLDTLVQFKFVDKRRKNETKEVIVDPNGKELDFSEVIPLYKSNPHLLFPNAKVTKIPVDIMNDLSFDLCLSNDLLIPFLTFLLQKIDKEIIHYRNFLETAHAPQQTTKETRPSFND